MATISEQQRQAFELAGMPSGWLRLLGLLLLAGVCYAVIWLYRREARAGAGVRLRSVLAGLRCLVLVALAGIWLEPVIATYTVRTISATVAVLTDVSASMAGFGVQESQFRVAEVGRLLEGEEQGWLKRLAAHNELGLYAFGEQTVRIRLPWEETGRAGRPHSPAQRAADPAPSGETPAPPDGTAGTGPGRYEMRVPPRSFSIAGTTIAVQNTTDPGQAVTTALDDAGESPVAGLVLISDGNFNKGMSVEDVAAAARRSRAPIYAIGVGSTEEPANIRVTNIVAPLTTPKGDPFELRVELAATGIEPTGVQLELSEQLGGGEERTIASRDVQLGGENVAAEIPFKIDADQAGEFFYRARVKPLEIEAVAFDNVREASVLVLDEQIRVLLVAGRPSYEYRYVTRLLERDRTVNLSCWLQSADALAVRDGNTPIAELPRRPQDVFAYDAIVLLDPNPGELDSSWAITARRLVDEFGGGLLLQAGPHFATRLLRDPRLEELVTMLPVIPDPDADVRLSEQGAYRTRSAPIRLPEQTRAHPLLTLHPDPETNQEIWSALPGIWWYLPVLREKPLASVLMRHGSRAHANRYGPAILMATQPFGSGRTAFLGFDNTWRWRGTGERYFNHFWVQLVRYLAQTRRAGASKRGTIVLDREAVNVGDYVKIEARVLDEAFVPWQAARIEVLLELGDGTRRSHTLNAVAGREGWFAGRVPFDRPGPAVVRVPLAGSGAADSADVREESLVKHVLVQQPDIELRSLRLRADRLAELAERTGGRYTPLEKAGELPDWIEAAEQVKVTRGSDTPLWDRGPVLIVVASLLAVEWALRRRHHLL